MTPWPADVDVPHPATAARSHTRGATPGSTTRRPVALPTAATLTACPAGRVSRKGSRAPHGRHALQRNVG
eukprot:323290-Chlamydomonas_euryale.AAC.1